MQKFETTQIYKLVPGDRFYKANDRSKNKKVYEIVEAEKKVTAFRTYSYWAVADGSDELIAFKGNTEVVFLRHNPDVPIVPRQPKHKRIKPSLEHYTLSKMMKR